LGEANLREARKSVAQSALDEIYARIDVSLLPSRTRTSKVPPSPLKTTTPVKAGGAGKKGDAAKSPKAAEKKQPQLEMEKSGNDSGKPKDPVTWDAFCNLPSATKAAIIGNDGTQWGKKGDWQSTSGINRKLSKIDAKAPEVNVVVKFGTTASNFVGYHVNNAIEGVLHGHYRDSCVVIRHLSTCFLIAIGPKSLQRTLIDEITFFGNRLQPGGY
jgi:hypothetical protein